jgi:coatomer subunit beta'
MASSDVSAVKFIARMQWVACGHGQGYITVYSYGDDRLTEIKRFQAEEGTVHALAVHPTLPYLLSSCKCNLIKLWDWEQGWVCSREFSSSSTDRYNMREMTFSPKDPISFACLDDDGEINVGTPPPPHTHTPHICQIRS